MWKCGQWLCGEWPCGEWPCGECGWWPWKMKARRPRSLKPFAALAARSELVAAAAEACTSRVVQSCPTAPLSWRRSSTNVSMWRGAPTRIAHNSLRPEARVARTVVGAMVINLICARGGRERNRRGRAMGARSGYTRHSTLAMGVPHAGAPTRVSTGWSLP